MVVPDSNLLTEAYRHARAAVFVEERSKELIADARRHGQEAEVPTDLAGQVASRLEDEPELSWDEAVKDIARRTPT